MSHETIYRSFLGAVDAIGVANGTDAIELSLKALNLAPGAEANLRVGGSRPRGVSSPGPVTFLWFECRTR